MRENKTTRANELATILAVIATVVAVISLALNVYQSVFHDRGIDAGKTFEASFSKSTPQERSFTIRPSKGMMKYGVSQTKGNTSCKYTLFYKKTSAKKWTRISKNNFNLQKNNVYYGAWNVAKTNGYNSYNVKLNKTAGKATASKLRVHWLLT